MLGRYIGYMSHKLLIINRNPVEFYVEFFSTLATHQMFFLGLAYPEGYALLLKKLHTQK